MTRYSKELAQKICRRLAQGEPVGVIARDPEMPPRSTIRHWIATDRDGLFSQTPRTVGHGAPPTLYTPRLAEKICDELAIGRPLAAIARDPSMPAAPTVIDWVKKDIDGFAAAYARAREFGRQALADEILDIADDKTVNIERARVRIAARQWLLVNMRPTYERAPLTVQIMPFGDEPETVADR